MSIMDAELYWLEQLHESYAENPTEDLRLLLLSQIDRVARLQQATGEVDDRIESLTSIQPRSGCIWDDLP